MDLLERRSRFREELLSFRSQCDLADAALEQRDAQAFFKTLDLPTHRAVRDVKLLGRAREALVAGRRDKGAHGVEGRFSKRHVCNFLTHGGR
jgi:hypothetical protein